MVFIPQVLSSAEFYYMMAEASESYLWLRLQQLLEETSCGGAPNGRHSTPNHSAHGGPPPSPVSLEQRTGKAQGSVLDPSFVTGVTSLSMSEILKQDHRFKKALICRLFLKAFISSIIQPIPLK